MKAKILYFLLGFIAGTILFFCITIRKPADGTRFLEQLKNTAEAMFQIVPIAEEK